MSVDVRVGERQDPRTAGVLGSAVLSALVFAVFVQLLLPLAVLAPFPLLVQRIRRGIGSAVLATLLAASLVGVVLGPGYALVYLLALVSPVLLIGESMARGRGLARGCRWAFALVALEIFAALFVAGPRLLEVFFLQTIDYYRSPAFVEGLRLKLPPEQVDEWLDRWNTLYGALQVVYPAAFTIFGALVVLANAALLRAYLVRRDPGWLEDGEFETVRWPLGMVVLFVLGGVAVAVPPVRPAGYNVLLLVAFFFALQGLAVVGYYVHRLAGPRLLRWALMALVLANPWVREILVLVGLFDTWFDFRKWADPPAPEEG